MFVLFKLVVILSFSAVSTYAEEVFPLPHRHRHSRSHSLDYRPLDSFMNRLDNLSPLTTAKPPSKGSVLKGTTKSTDLDPGNSLWDVTTTSHLDGLHPPWLLLDKNGEEEEKRRVEIEDSLDEKEEQSEEEDGFEDQKEQADSRAWNIRNNEPYSNWKWDNLASRKVVDNHFHVYKSGILRPDATNKEGQAQWEVYNHNKIMSRETQCKHPRPKVIKVADVYPSNNKLYVPACTVLHQCGDDTGCCAGSSKCGPKTTNRVELYFFTAYIVGPQNQQRTGNSMERLPFYNHTECECQDKLEEVMPRDGNSNEYSRTERISENNCKCPSEYTVRRLANGSCSCDCFDKQRDCIKYKKGKGYFNHSDRLCIEVGTCQLPSCDFGIYLRSSGRCPRKHEKFRSWSRFH